MTESEELPKWTEPKKWYVTFGSQYNREEHPQGGHPDGVFEILANSESEARDKAFAHMGPKWSILYPEENFDWGWYPLGVLKTL